MNTLIDLNVSKAVAKKKKNLQKESLGVFDDPGEAIAYPLYVHSRRACGTLRYGCIRRYRISDGPAGTAARAWDSRPCSRPAG